MALPAAATVEKSGTQYCQSGQTPRADARATGYLGLKGPGDSYYDHYQLGATFQTRTNVGPGGYRRAYSQGGALDDQNTYGRCLAGSAPARG